MTKRSDIRRLAASLAVLGTELEMKGEEALDRLAGWEQGPTKAPGAAGDDVCACGHADTSHNGPCLFVDLLHDGETWACPCNEFTPLPRSTSADDQAGERKAAQRAGLHRAEFVADLTEIDRLVQRINRRLDMACPPDVSELRNRATGEFEPETATDALTSGFCPNCWSCGIKYVPLSPLEGSSSVRRYADRCRPCGDFRKAEQIDKPKALVVAHSENRRMTREATEQIIKAAKAAANPKKKGKSKRGKKAA